MEDFNWREVGVRIRHVRLARRMSQQQLAEQAGITQNAVFRIEAGETNPQLATLKQIAGALGESVRGLICGEQKVDDFEVAPWLSRVRKIVTSGDRAAIQALQNGLENAELLRSRAGRQGLPPIVVKGEDQSPHNLFWSQLPIKRRSIVEETAGSRNMSRQAPAAVRKPRRSL